MKQINNKTLGKLNVELYLLFWKKEWICKIELKGPRHTRHFGTQYCDKKIFLSHGYLKAKVSSWQKIIQGTKNQGKIFKNLPWLVIETCGSKLSFYRNIFLSKYRNIVCKNISCDMGLREREREREFIKAN